VTEYKNAESVKDPSGRQYHIGLSPEEVAEYVMVVGDPARAERVAGLFDRVRVSCKSREFVTFTGSYRGNEITVMATGIGCDNTEIAVIELCQLRFPLTIIRCGSCGGLQSDMEIGDLVISAGAMRLENTSTFFVEEGFPAIASHEIVLALLKAVADEGVPHHLGITATASGFYGAQGRRIPGFPVRDQSLMDRLATQGIKNFEMETSTLLTLAALRGFRAGAVCAVFASRPRNEFIDTDQKGAAELKAIKTTLRAFEYIREMDRQKDGSPFWLPEL
jgi:uridine phosphorylase